jgi:DNA (cytosine-5)-methyltransferase 1
MAAKTFKIIDLFAGIGGTRLGFERAGFESVFSNEIDKFSCETYKTNFGDDPFGDITKIDPKDIPNFDVLVGGFPCQAFSIAGQKLGFKDTRGTLFFDVARILKAKQPKSFLLENVKNLKSHDGGKTFEVVRSVIDELGYDLYETVLNAKDFGLAQNRPRVILVGFRKDLGVKNFEFPKGIGQKPLETILEKNVGQEYFISKQRHIGMERHRKKHEAKGHGFGYSVLDAKGISHALVCGGMGRERNIVKDDGSAAKISKDVMKNKSSENIRYLTPREMARLQGFPDTFKIPVSRTQAWKQFSNSVPVSLVEAVAKNIKKALLNPKAFCALYNVSPSSRRREDT